MYKREFTKYARMLFPATPRDHSNSSAGSSRQSGRLDVTVASSSSNRRRFSSKSDNSSTDLGNETNNGDDEHSRDSDLSDSDLSDSDLSDSDLSDSDLSDSDLSDSGYRRSGGYSGGDSDGDSDNDRDSDSDNEESNGRGRRYAVKFLEQFPVGTMGHLVHQTVSPFARVFGDFASGEIGGHYEQVAQLLGQPVTEERIDAFAANETRWWHQQSGFAGTLGLLMTKEMRKRILMEKARQLDVLPRDPKPDQKE